MDLEKEVIIISDTEDEFSDSDYYVPESPKKKSKKAEGKTEIPAKKPRKQAVPKEKKPKAAKPKTERKRAVKKNKANVNDVNQGQIMDLEKEVIIISDTEDEFSDSDDYVPESPKKKSKKAEGKTEIPAKKPMKQAVPKEKKPKAAKPKTERKRAVKKNKADVNDVNQGPSDGTSSIQEGESIKIREPERMEWNEAESIAEQEQIEVDVAKNITRLLDENNTIPFIACYRKELTNDMSPEKLREVKAAYDIVRAVKQKAAEVMTAIADLEKLTPFIERSIRCARTINELDHIYTPFKPGSKRTLAERARQLGLDEPANALLTGSRIVIIEELVKPETKGLENLKVVETGLQHIIADVISKDRNLLDYLMRIKNDAHIRLESSKAPLKSNKQKEKTEEKKIVNKIVDNESKFENYFNFIASVKYIKPHQVLAVNRGENLKVLSVKLIIPDWVFHRLRDFCNRQWLSRGLYYPLRSRLVDCSIQDSYTRLIQPLLIRQMRSELTQKAERAAIEVFAVNLKRLLLSPPFRGKVVLGIDPGFRNGCEIGITSATGTVLATDVIYPHCGKKVYPNSDPSALKLKELLTKFSCEVIALGNGTACRETESYLSELIQNGWFRPLDVKYTIVNDKGASIYSCSPIAQKEFPGTDPNVISAVSLARRLQDPLGEFVKVEPKHLGVGMYQHDVPEKQLSSTLDEIVVECVSFVGVDVNIASDCLLRRVAGLNSARADKIIEWRKTNGPFTNRQQLLKIKGIGPKTFEQCAGFVRVIPETARRTSNPESPGTSKPKKMKMSDDSENPLDRTWIHPESYSVALRFVKKCDLSLDDLGKPQFIRKVGDTVNRIGLKNIAEEFGVAEALIKLISEGLQQSPDHDFRSQFQEPLFRTGVTSLEKLQIGAVLTGRTQNVTHFGTFVDIGVGKNGLIPASGLRDMRPQLGDRIEVKVFAIDIKRQRITLNLLRIL